MIEFFISLITATIRLSCPIILGAVGEIHSQKSGVMNLGVEGMMMFGVFSCFVTMHYTDSFVLGILGAVLAGMFLAFLHSVITIILTINQALSGLMIGFLGIGLADFLGRSFTGIQISNFSSVNLGILSKIPYLGEPFFSQNPLVYVTLIVSIFSWYLFKHLHLGKIIISVGDNPKSAEAAGINVLKVRIWSVLYGGALAGLAGAYLSLNYSRTFISEITAGRGWIAIALVFFANWQPRKAILGGLLFGGLEALTFRLSYLGVDISHHILNTLPHVITIAILVLTSIVVKKDKPIVPQSLGANYKRQ